MLNRIWASPSSSSHSSVRDGGRLNPVVLDALYYDRGWNPLPQERFSNLQRELVAQERWIIEGNYASTLPIRLAAADTVIFCDLPALVCLWGVLERRLRHGAGQHGAIGVYDRITWDFICYILGYRRSMRPRVQRLLAEHASHADLVVLRSRRAARRYLVAVSVTGVAQARPLDC